MKPRILTYFQWITALALVIGTLAGAAEEPSHDCFRIHLEDAIKSNHARKLIYSKETGGASRQLSDHLIASEEAAVLVARYFDWKARPYQEKGIPLFCRDFISMSLIPELKTFVQASQDSVPPQKLDSVQLLIDLNEPLLRNEFEKIAESSKLYLKQMEGFPYRSCMLRHVIESIRRAAQLAPIYMAQAKEKGLPSPAGLIRQFIASQATFIPVSFYFDKKAEPFQERGIPIICQDVPHIPAIEE